MGQYFQFINFDKHQSTHEIGKINEIYEGTIIKNLMVPIVSAFPKLEDVFKQVFGYEIPRSFALDRTALGHLGKLPNELITYIFHAATVEGALALGIAHGYLFAIGYSEIIAQTKRTHPVMITNWSYDRIICLGDCAELLPPNYLSLTEKGTLMEWSVKHGEHSNESSPSGKLDDDGDDIAPTDVTDLQPQELERALTTFEDQTFSLWNYGYSMPSIFPLERRAFSRYPPSNNCHWWHRVDDGRARKFGCQIARINLHRYQYSTRVLVNVTKKQFLRATDASGHNTLPVAVPLLTLWGGVDAGEKRVGPWAGDRLAIVPHEVFEDMRREEPDEEWGERFINWNSD
ncbi:hypothetical protein BDN71DRAFT_1592249 [Pleurotus eryngii]|uniref:Uncharacterized protein n=1 Tax=Pleurotus eryngii TaxID=5323 RepID=A0A9P5ZQ58_PLEER|nr:hypothetical protein BDN71DRAFT_1592249 [Pleurotus eryngii]